MLKNCPIAAAILAIAAMASPSFAQTFSPSSGSVTGTGPIRFQQTYSLNCTLSITAAPLSATTAPIPTRTVSPGDFICLTVIPFGAWKIDVVPGSINSIALTIGATSGQPCYGTTIVAWNNANSTATFNNNILPAVNPADPPCAIVAGFIRIPGLQIL